MGRVTPAHFLCPLGAPDRSSTLMPAVRQAADGSDHGRLRFRN